MKIYNLKCPGCGADLEFSSDLNIAYCHYCGAKLYLDDGSTKSQTRIIDEARIKEAEVKMKELEHRYSAQERENDHYSEQLIIWNNHLKGWAILFVVLMIISLFSDIFKLFLVYWFMGGFIYFLCTKPTYKNRTETDATQYQANTTLTRSNVASFSHDNQPYFDSRRREPKKKWASLLLCLMFGVFGAHKFYEGKTAIGVLYIFTLGFLGIGVLIDFIILLTKPNEYDP